MNGSEAIDDEIIEPEPEPKRYSFEDLFKEG